MTGRATAPEPADDTSAATPSVYALLKERTERAVTPTITKRHPKPGMEDVSLTFLPDIPFKTYDSWVRWATSKDAKKEVDYGKFNRRVIAETCVGIAVGGEVMTDDDGPVTFRTIGFIDQWDGTAIGAVGGFIDNDGGINALASAITTAAGYGVQLEEAEAPKGL